MNIARRDMVKYSGLSLALTMMSLDGAAGASAAVARGSVTPPKPSLPLVGRTTATLKYRANVRDIPSLFAPSRVVGTVADATALKGSYDASGLWFRIMTGPFAGRWVTAAVLVAAPARTVNGRVAASALTRLPSWCINRDNLPGQARYLSRPAASAYLAMAAAFKATFRVDLTITEAYRPLARQQLLYRTLGPSRAAVPGTSNHGLGNAVDLGIAGTNAITSKLYYGRPYDVWLTRNAGRWGFDRPAYMDRYGSQPEWWHYNFVG